MSATTLPEAGLPGTAISLQGTFARCAEQGRAALVLYTTAGYPSPAAGVEVLQTLADAGADVIELGVPFSDPLADGPTIQHSSQVALDRGVDLDWTLRCLARFRETHRTPVVLFSYLNPIFRHGMERFLADAHAAGAQGVLLTDLPMGAAPELEQALTDAPLDFVRLIAPTTPAHRARAIAAVAQGFVYYVSRTGVTGAQHALAETLLAEVEQVRAAAVAPVAVGFGISTPAQAAAVAAVADGVVVGSALVHSLGETGIAGARRLASALRAAMNRNG